MSLGLRGGGIFGGAALLSSLTNEEGLDDLGAVILGGFAGFAIASFTDAVILSHKPVPAPRFTPMLSVQPGGASVGFNLRF